VLNYDRRGRGDSGDTAPYAVDREYEDLEAVIDAAGGSASLFGNSGGGILALEAAARGLAVTRIAVWEPPYIIDGSRPPVPADYRRQLGDLLAAGRRGDMVELFLTQAAGIPATFVASIRQSPFWASQEAVAHASCTTPTSSATSRCRPPAWPPSRPHPGRRGPDPVAEHQRRRGRRRPPRRPAPHP
jgi:pimeloyl-ACP methyl ester carboxylesterase